MRLLAVLLLGTGLAACHNDLRTQTHAFVAETPCGQGPYDIHLKADGTTGEEGIEIVACTDHALAGTVELTMNGLPFPSHRFGERADNARCLAGGPIVATAGAGSGGGAGEGGGAPGTRAASPVLVERPYHGSETPFDDELCQPYGLGAQTLMMPTVTTTNVIPPGADLHVRIWSDVPNDLEHVVFMIRHVTSTKSKAEIAKEDAAWQKKHAHDPPSHAQPRAPVAHHGAPPPPLAEQPPPRPTAAAVWIGGSWTWTGSQWGWVAGFWRDDGRDAPAPRVEVPGPPPLPTAVWITGRWQLRAGAWVWIRGRWR